MAHDNPSRWPDEEVLATYRRIVTSVDAPPAYVLAAAQAAFLARDLDAEIALLVADSRAMAGEAVFESVRSDPDVAQGRWLLSFEGGGVQAEIEVEESEEGIRLVGMLSGASADDCYLESAGDRRRVDVDDLGRFMIDDVAHGPIRLRCRSFTGARVITAWVTV
jgi:hypothetical protein